jgi:hypothetical protein
MKLYVKILTGELIVIEVETPVTKEGIMDAIHTLCPEWGKHRIILFSTNHPGGVLCTSLLNDEDMICMFLMEPQYIQIVTGADHQYFSLHVSTKATFGYPHTRSLFFEFRSKDEGPTEKDAFYYFAKNTTCTSLEEMIRLNTEYPPQSVDYIVECATKCWEEIMRYYPSKRKEYMKRLDRVQNVGW